MISNDDVKYFFILDNIKYKRNDIFSESLKSIFKKKFENTINRHSKYKNNLLLRESLKLKLIEKYGEEKIRKNNKLPKITVIVSTNRIHNFQYIIDNFNRQCYQNKELIIIINLDKNETIMKLLKCNTKNIKIFQKDENVTLGECLNFAVDKSNGDFISKFDDDDYYSVNYLLNYYKYYLLTGSDVLGKFSYLVLKKNNNALWVRKIKGHHYNKTNDFVAGATLFVKKSVFNEIRFGKKNKGEDTYFINQCFAKGKKIFTTSFFDFCNFRDSEEKHTFKNINYLTKRRDKYIGRYKNIPYKIFNHNIV